MGSQAVTSKFGALLEDPIYTDLTLKCEGEDFYVHKCIVCLQSPVFAAACGGNFKEATEHSFEISVINRSTLRRMLKYFYTNNYDDTSASMTTKKVKVFGDTEDHLSGMEDSRELKHYTREQKTEEAESSNKLMAHAQVFIAADYYQVPKLLDLALEKFEEASTVDVCLAELHEVVALVYNFDSDRADILKSFLCSVALRHAAELVADEGFMETSVQFPEFMKDILPDLVKDQKCSRCRRLCR